MDKEGHLSSPRMHVLPDTETMAKCTSPGPAEGWGLVWAISILNNLSERFLNFLKFEKYSLVRDNFCDYLKANIISILYGIFATVHLNSERVFIFSLFLGFFGSGD